MLQTALLAPVNVRDVYQNKRRVVRSGSAGGERSPEAESGFTGSEKSDMLASENIKSLAERIGSCWRLDIMSALPRYSAALA